jgi:demethylmenaquinone methyltransferase/2-methoxy-6-polyprenyl-1,4-benzoquinol methylase
MCPLVADAIDLPLRDACASGAIVGFGIRNLADLPAGLHEVFRVLEPGARFVILELSTPESFLVRSAYSAYFHHVLPHIGRLVSGHRTAYRYLPESVKSFPSKGGLAAMLEQVGFSHVEWNSLTCGVVAIHSGVKP